MTYARIPNFSQPVPVRSTRARIGRRQIPLDRRYRNLPGETQPGTIEAWEAVCPVRPDTAQPVPALPRYRPRAAGPCRGRAGGALIGVRHPFRSRAYRPGRLPPGLPLHTPRPDIMGDVLTFTPRPKPAAPVALEPLAAGDLRASLEEAAQVALDAADRIIAVLDRMDDDTDLEDGADAEPSLAAPENHTGNQVVWLRGNDADREIEAPEVVLREMAVEAVVLPWRGRGNVIAAAGVLLVDLLGHG